MTIRTSQRRSDWMTWLVAGIALIAIATAVGLGLQIAKEARDTRCARNAAARDRTALVQLETAQRDRLQHPGEHVAADVVVAINHYLATVKADDTRRVNC